MATSTRVTYERPWLYPKQRDALFHVARYGLIEASTKSGKSMGAWAWLLEEALLGGKDGRNYWWVAPVSDQARIIFDRGKRSLPPESFAANETYHFLHLLNGARIWFKSGDHPDSLYGEDVWAVVIDEASRLKEDAWHAVRTTLTKTKGPVRIIGNVKGRRNWFWRMARQAEGGAPDMSYARITARDAIEAGILSAQEIDDARRLLPANIFQELYMAEAGDDAGNPFGLEAIRTNIVSSSSIMESVVFGVDLAKSVDWSVIVGLDRAGSVSSFQRFQRPWQETFEAVLRTCGRRRTLVDATGVGDPIVESLQRKGGGNFVPYVFTAGSKQQLMEGLAVAIQSGAVHYPAGPLVQELESFEYEYTRNGVHYGAPEGMHDDCVMALALAVEARGGAGSGRIPMYGL